MITQTEDIGTFTLRVGDGVDIMLSIYYEKRREVLRPDNTRNVNYQSHHQAATNLMVHCSAVSSLFLPFELTCSCGVAPAPRVHDFNHKAHA